MAESEWKIQMKKRKSAARWWTATFIVRNQCARMKYSCKYFLVLVYTQKLYSCRIKIANTYVVCWFVRTIYGFNWKFAIPTKPNGWSFLDMPHTKLFILGFGQTVFHFDVICVCFHRLFLFVVLKIKTTLKMVCRKSDIFYEETEKTAVPTKIDVLQMPRCDNDYVVWCFVPTEKQ